MVVYKCKKCGWKFCEEDNDKCWNEISDDFKCPICMADKSRFKKID